MLKAYCVTRQCVSLRRSSFSPSCRTFGRMRQFFRRLPPSFPCIQPSIHSLFVHLSIHPSISVSVFVEKATLSFGRKEGRSRSLLLCTVLSFIPSLGLSFVPHPSVPSRNFSSFCLRRFLLIYSLSLSLSLSPSPILFLLPSEDFLGPKKRLC